MSYVYLASPYTHPLKSIMASRFEAVMNSVAECAKHGVPVYSPIVHWHVPAIIHNLPPTEDFWREQNAGMLTGCRELWILCLPGWNDSRGIEWEQSKVWHRTTPIYVLPSDIPVHCKGYLDRCART